MAILEVYTYPSPKLRKIADPVEKVALSTIKPLIKDMFDTMYDQGGVGLAATQVGRAHRLIVIDVGDDSEPLCLINPEITHKEGRTKHKEGCLSIPNFYAEVERAEKVTCTYLDENFDEHTIEAEGLMAVCIQHEIDHLDGKLFVDHLSSIKKRNLHRYLEGARA